MKPPFAHPLFIAVCGMMFTLTGFAADKSAAASAHERVSVEQFETLWKSKQFQVLDVRRAVEFEEGHIPGALNIDYYGKDFKDRVGKLDKTKPWLVHCRSGGRSGSAAKIMTALGFTKVYDLAPGMSGWEKAGKPVVTGSAAPAK